MLGRRGLRNTGSYLKSPDIQGGLGLATSFNRLVAKPKFEVFAVGGFD